MNETSCVWRALRARQIVRFGVFIKYMAVQAFPIRRLSPRLAPQPELCKPARSRIPAQSPEQGAASLREMFYGSMPIPSAMDPQFEDALRYVLVNPGSMVRPRVALSLASAYGVDAKGAHDLAIALEYFHTASLIFDDMPCMDNAVEQNMGQTDAVRIRQAKPQPATKSTPLQTNTPPET